MWYYIRFTVVTFCWFCFIFFSCIRLNVRCSFVHCSCLSKILSSLMNLISMDYNIVEICCNLQHSSNSVDFHSMAQICLVIMAQPKFGYKLQLRLNFTIDIWTAVAWLTPYLVKRMQVSCPYSNISVPWTECKRPDFRAAN